MLGRKAVTQRVGGGDLSQPSTSWPGRRRLKKSARRCASSRLAERLQRQDTRVESVVFVVAMRGGRESTDEINVRCRDVCDKVMDDL